MARPLVVDLFSGAGGFSLGFEQAGFDIAAAVELDPIHAAVHEFNFPYGTVLCKDITVTSGDEIRRQSRIGNKDIAVVIGGAPCQGFSMIGKRVLDDPRNKLVNHFVRVVKELQPAYFVFENVKGLTLGNQRHFLAAVIEAFSTSGYNILLPYKVLNAKHFGVPQSRERLFLIGALDGNPLPEYPIEQSKRVTIREAIGDLPEAEDYEELLASDCVKAVYAEPSAYAQKLRNLNQINGNWGYLRGYDPSILTSSPRTKHSPLSRRRFSETPMGKTEPVSRFFKLDWNGVSNTLRAGTASDRGAYTAPRPIHPVAPRCITVREAARIHSYPDWFRFHVTKWHGFRQIGNSVPPLLAQAVGEKIAQAMGYQPKVPEKTIQQGKLRLLELTMSQASEYFGLEGNAIPTRSRSKVARNESQAHD